MTEVYQWFWFSIITITVLSYLLKIYSLNKRLCRITRLGDTNYIQSEFTSFEQ